VNGTLLVSAKSSPCWNVGHNSLVAKSLLASFEQLQNMHIAHRDRSEKALAEISK
jgi:hypothetical protein